MVTAGGRALIPHAWGTIRYEASTGSRVVRGRGPARGLWRLRVTTTDAGRSARDTQVAAANNHLERVFDGLAAYEIGQAIWTRPAGLPGRRRLGGRSLQFGRDLGLVAPRADELVDDAGVAFRVNRQVNRVAVRDHGVTDRTGFGCHRPLVRGGQSR